MLVTASEGVRFESEHRQQMYGWVECVLVQQEYACGRAGRRAGKLEEALRLLARRLYEQGKLNLEEAFVDATFASAKKGAFAICPTRRGKGTNIVAIQAFSMQAPRDNVLASDDSRACGVRCWRPAASRTSWARAIVALSSRAHKPYIRLNCAALPENLIESELFGSERGAFTGATESRPGQIELADGGTLFLDEIATLTPAAANQAAACAGGSSGAAARCPDVAQDRFSAYLRNQ